MSALFGTIAGGAAIQAGLGAINNIWAQQQQSEARRENYMYGEMAARNADARTRALYNSFYSPEALMRQYRSAGLSPSMMFGGTPGQGGMSGAQGTGAAGLPTPYMPMSMIEGAQIGLINAQAEKTKAETKTIEETREPTIQEIWSNIAVNTAEAGYKAASEELVKQQTEVEKILVEFKKETYWDDVSKVRLDIKNLEENNKKLMAEAKSAIIKSEVDEATQDEAIELAEKQVELLTQQILDSKQGRQLTAAQTQYFIQMAKSAAYQMQLDYFYAQKKQVELDLQISHEKWMRHFEKWLAKGNWHMQKQGLEIQQWRTKWDMMGRMVQAFTIVGGLNATTGKKAYKTPRTNSSTDMPNAPTYY